MKNCFPRRTASSALLLAASLAISLPGLVAAATPITTWAELDAMRLDLDGDYELMNDLGPSDAGYATYAASTANANAGWLPVGNSTTPFTGTLDGQGNTITGLRVRNFTSEIGFFGALTGATIGDISFIDASVQNIGGGLSGGLAGRVDSSIISDIRYQGSVSSGAGGVGGIAAVAQNSSSFSNCYAIGAFTSAASSPVGGIVGDLINSSVVDAFTRLPSQLSTSQNAGGVVGRATNSTITRVYSFGEVTTGGSFAGGLVGQLADSTLGDGYTTVRQLNPSSFGVGAAVGFTTGTNTTPDLSFNADLSNTSNDAVAATSLVTAQMIGLAPETNMAGFDYTNDWYTVQSGVPVGGITPDANAYPILRGLPIIPQLITVGGLQPSYTINYVAGTGGTLTGTATQTITTGEDGSAVTAVPDLNYVFDQWSDGVTTATRTDSIVTAGATHTATFTFVSSISDWTIIAD